MATKKSFSTHVPWPRPAMEETVKSNKNFRRNFHAAVLYAHYELSAIELKREVVKYLKSINPKHELLNEIKDIHENRFTTVGKYMYLLNHGADVPEDILPGVMPALEKVIYDEKIKAAQTQKEAIDSADGPATKDTAETIKSTISIQDRIKEKTHDVAGEIEGWIDEFIMDKKSPVKSVEDFVTLFKSSELKAPHARIMHTIFKHRADEIAEAALGKDKDLAEAYSNFTKPELKKHDLFHKNLLAACVMLQEVAKVERAPRKKKPVAKEKIISKLKYKKEDTTLGIVSVSPSQILGAKEVWVYNTKTRKLGQYKAADAQGIGVKGIGLLNYTPDSIEKTVRKPAETLAEFKKASKVKLRTFLKDIVAIDIALTGKLNENHIILRIDK